MEDFIDDNSYEYDSKDYRDKEKDELDMVNDHFVNIRNKKEKIKLNVLSLNDKELLEICR